MNNKLNFKVGNKVKYVKNIYDVIPQYNCIVKQIDLETECFAKLGDILEITAICNNEKELITSIQKIYLIINHLSDINDSTYPWLEICNAGHAPAECFELVVENKCICPSVNFSWNGWGCVCGQMERERDQF